MESYLKRYDKEKKMKIESNYKVKVLDEIGPY